MPLSAFLDTPIQLVATNIFFATPIAMLISAADTQLKISKTLFAPLQPQKINRQVTWHPKMSAKGPPWLAQLQHGSIRLDIPHPPSLTHRHGNMAVLNPWRTNLGNFLLLSNAMTFCEELQMMPSENPTRLLKSGTARQYLGWSLGDFGKKSAGKDLEFGSEKNSKTGDFTDLRGNVVNECKWTNRDSASRMWFFSWFSYHEKTWYIYQETWRRMTPGRQGRC